MGDDLLIYCPRVYPRLARDGDGEGVTMQAGRLYVWFIVCSVCDGYSADRIAALRRAFDLYRESRCACCGKGRAYFFIGYAEGC